MQGKVKVFNLNGEVFDSHSMSIRREGAPGLENCSQY